MFKAEDFQTGQILLVNKPLGYTSFQAVNKLRWAIRRTFGLKRIKVGHAGTLDPLASGLLIICTGKMTKRIHEFMGADKTYTGTLVLGAVTPSHDLETEPLDFRPWEQITEEQIRHAAASLEGEIMQRPPVFSALKRDGKPLYELARAGEEVEVPARPVSIRSFRITEIRGAEVDFEVLCGKGTYIRSLAHDLGQTLGCGAYLKALCRTAIGEYRLEDARGLDEWADAIRTSTTGSDQPE